MKNIKNRESGFTIIEVVLVLAIAGLIFLVVFLALPQLQKSQRDSQRRADAGRFLSALETSSSNNNGNYPTTTNIVATDANSFVVQYLRNDGADWADPNGTDYVILASSNATDPALVEPAGVMYYGFSSQCGAAEGTFDDATGNRKIAIMVALENGIAYCQDNR